MRPWRRARIAALLRVAIAVERLSGALARVSLYTFRRAQRARAEDREGGNDDLTAARHRRGAGPPAASDS
jgi:hypothetical protein